MKDDSKKESIQIDEEHGLTERDPNTVDWVEEETGISHNHLNPIRHPQRDFFIADLFEAVSLQLDQASMEFPLFALKAGDTKPRYYEQNGVKVKIDPNSAGIATIHDKDVWIYSISKLMQAQSDGEPIDRTVHFTIYDYLKTTNRAINGTTYERAKDSLDRLAGTRITTEIETAKTKEARGFGLVDTWRIVEEKDGRMVRVSVTLPEWLYRSVTSKNVLTLSSEYFRLRKPLDRRIYELARKHCGNNNSWSFNLKTLHERTGSTASIREFKRSIKSLADSNQLPDYSVVFIDKKDRKDKKQCDDQVIFYKRKRALKNNVDDSKCVSLADFTSKYGSGDKDEIARKIFAEGKLLSQEVIKHFKFTPKGIKILQQQSTIKPAEPKQQTTYVFNDKTVQHLYNVIESNLIAGKYQTEEIKRSFAMIEINEAYDSISSNKKIVDDNDMPISEMSFKSSMYKAFGIEK